MDNIGVQVGVLLAVLLLVERLVAARRRDGRGGLAPVLTWLVLTAVLLWCGALLAFAAVHALLFTLGPDAATAGAVVCGAALIAIPFVLAVIIRRNMRHVSTGG